MTVATSTTRWAVLLNKEEDPAEPGQDQAHEMPKLSGQMAMIQAAVEQLLQKGAPLPLLKPAHALARVTEQLMDARPKARSLSARAPRSVPLS